MRVISKIYLFLQTVRYLKLIQIFYRIKYKILPIRSAGIRNQSFERRKLNIDFPVWANSSWNEDGVVSYLNTEIKVDYKNTWEVEADVLWLYNLHYFDDLNSYAVGSKKKFYSELINSWISCNNQSNDIAWASYPISLRIVNWCKFFWRINDIDSDWIKSLWVQAEWLFCRLEYHILGNHLYANAKALVFVGVFLGGDFGDRLLIKGLSIVNSQNKEQFLQDGGHFERSPMYHNIMLWDLLDLIFLAEHSGNIKLSNSLAEWKSIALKAIEWMGKMAHPDGDIAFFNDAALGIAPTYADICMYAERLALCSYRGGDCKLVKAKMDYLEDTGYICLKNQDYKVILDVADVGPDYLPGHAHADTLSLELSLLGRRIIVNSGTSVYGISDERHRQRSTKAHNTICIDDDNSSEVWGGFRVARRARVFDINVDFDSMIAIASHDGYKRLPGRPIHQRKITLQEKQLTVEDNITGDGKHEIEVIWHLHPDVKCCWKDEMSAIVLQFDSDESCKRVNLSIDGIEDFHVKESTWHPEFGKAIPNFSIVGVIQDVLPISITTTLSLLA